MLVLRAPFFIGFLHTFLSPLFLYTIQVLGGLLHCDFWDPSGKKSLLVQFQNQMKSATLPKKSSAATVKRAVADPLLERHAGVLGLCAFVAASPYDVPEYLPEVIVSLGDFLHDPPPIPVSTVSYPPNVIRLLIV